MGGAIAYQFNPRNYVSLVHASLFTNIVFRKLKAYFNIPKTLIAGKLLKNVETDAFLIPLVSSRGYLS